MRKYKILGDGHFKLKLNSAPTPTRPFSLPTQKKVNKRLARRRSFLQSISQKPYFVASSRLFIVLLPNKV